MLDGMDEVENLRIRPTFFCVERLFDSLVLELSLLLPHLLKL